MNNANSKQLEADFLAAKTIILGDKVRIRNVVNAVKFAKVKSIDGGFRFDYKEFGYEISNELLSSNQKAYLVDYVKKQKSRSKK